MKKIYCKTSSFSRGSRPKVSLKISQNIHWKTPMRKCFPEIFANILRSSILRNTSMWVLLYITAQKMMFSIKNFFIKCDQIHSFLRIWSYLLRKSLIKNFIFCAVYGRSNRLWTLWKVFESPMNMHVVESLFQKCCSHTFKCWKNTVLNKQEVGKVLEIW